MENKNQFNISFSNPEPEYILVRTEFIQDMEVSFDAKGAYLEYKAGVIQWEDIPEKYRLEINTSFKKIIEKEGV